MSFTVGISNSRLATAKRGIAVEVATQLALLANTPVCLVGADPTDRDVDRHLPRLAEAWGQPARMDITRGPHHVEIANFARSRVCAVSISDRESVEEVFPILQQRFRYVIVDAPSRAGFGVGIAGVLLGWLDALVIGTGLTAGEIAETRRYLERLDSIPSAQHVDRRVLPIGDTGVGFSEEQLELRLASLPTIGHVPRLGGGVAAHDTIAADDLRAAFRPLVQWIMNGPTSATPPPIVDIACEPASTERHVANRLYRES